MEEVSGWQNFFYIRLFAPLLLFLPFPNILKIVLIFLTDIVDNKLYQSKDNVYNTKYFEYQFWDKMLDLYVEAYIMFYLLSFKILNPTFNIFILLLFILRAIGTFFFLKTRKTIYLKIFPDAFREFVLILLVSDYFPKINNFIIKNVESFTIVVYFAKAIVECFMHKVKEYPLLDQDWKP